MTWGACAMNLQGVLVACLFAFLACGRFVEWTPFGMLSPEALPFSLHKAALSRLAEHPQCDSFSVAFVGVVHNNYRGFRTAVERVNRQNVAFVVVLGDVTNVGLLAEYERFLRYASALRHPWFVVLGNHDALGYGGEIYERVFGEGHGPRACGLCFPHSTHQR